MSAGVFTRSFYQTDAGQVRSIKIQPETLTAQGSNTVAGPATERGNVYASIGNRRRYGVHARYLTLAWAATVPDGYDPNSNVHCIILSPTYFNSLSEGNTFTYLGVATTIVGLNGERRR